MSDTARTTRPPLPPFTRETAELKVKAAEKAWNTRDPETVSKAYSVDTVWRNRDIFLNGREEVRAFLSDKWNRELDYRLKKTLWAYTQERIAVKFIYEWRDSSDQWHRSHGNEMWEFASDGLMKTREASINDVRIQADERTLF